MYFTPKCVSYQQGRMKLPNSQWNNEKADDSRILLSMIDITTTEMFLLLIKSAYASTMTPYFRRDFEIFFMKLLMSFSLVFLISFTLQFLMSFFLELMLSLFVLMPFLVEFLKSLSLEFLKSVFLYLLFVCFLLCFLVFNFICWENVRAMFLLLQLTFTQTHANLRYGSLHLRIRILF